VDCNGRTFWIADVHRDDRKRFVVRADEKLTAFIELESAIRGRRLHPLKYQELHSISQLMHRFSAVGSAKV
jgi:hypothetical protein